MFGIERFFDDRSDEIAELRAQLARASATITEQDSMIKEYQDKYRPICNELCELTLAHNKLKEEFNQVIDELEQSSNAYEKLVVTSDRTGSQLKTICKSIHANLHDMPMLGDTNWYMIKLTSKQVMEIGGIAK
jgi:uncharacterized coiled-coil DUF342 family protein